MVKSGAYCTELPEMDSNFHQKCDHFEKTLVVIKSTSGNIFGGFTSKPWNSISDFANSDLANYGYVSDASAFIFSLVNKNNKPFKTVNSCNKGIFCDKDNGPSFGYGNLEGIRNITYMNPFYDLKICSDSNMNQTSNSNFGYGFKNPDYLEETEAKAFLAGSYNFQNVEIEVFTHSDE